MLSDPSSDIGANPQMRRRKLTPSDAWLALRCTASTILGGIGAARPSFGRSDVEVVNTNFARIRDAGEVIVMSVSLPGLTMQEQIELDKKAS